MERLVYYCLIFRGKIRRALLKCPKCNSSAPALDRCNVCKGYRRDEKGFPDVYRLIKWRRAYTVYLNAKQQESKQ